MLFSEINPFVRYARYLDLNENFVFNEVVPLDARLFFAAEGYGKIKVGDCEYEMSRDSLLIINSGIPYRLTASVEGVSYIALNFDYTQRAVALSTPVAPVLKNTPAKDELLDFCSFEDAAALSGVFYVKSVAVVRMKLAAIVHEYKQKLLYSNQKCGHMLAECIADAMRLSESGSITSEGSLSGLIISYIHNHYKENLTNHSIGRFFGYHPNYVSALIKQITGMPLHKYIIHVRLMNAVSLLENTAFSVGEIALQCGFCDAAYFSRYFKRHFGISPSKYVNI